MILQKYLEELNKWSASVHAEDGWENIHVLKQIELHLGLTFVPEPFGSAEGTAGNVCFAESPEVRDDYKETFAPIDLLDYIYAVLHSSNYRKKYKESWTIDILRVPNPADPNHFWKLVALGGKLRQQHMLVGPKVKDCITSFPIVGNNIITNGIGEKDWELTSPNKSQEEAIGRVWINEEQYFDKIPLAAWNLYIGGYQPAQKWLKKRRGRMLNFEHILYYEKIIVALTETDRIIEDINSIEIT